MKRLLLFVLCSSFIFSLHAVNPEVENLIAKLGKQPIAAKIPTIKNHYNKQTRELKAWLKDFDFATLIDGEKVMLDQALVKYENNQLKTAYDCVNSSTSKVKPEAKKVLDKLSDTINEIREKISRAHINKEHTIDLNKSSESSEVEEGEEGLDISEGSSPDRSGEQSVEPVVQTRPENQEIQQSQPIVHQEAVRQEEVTTQETQRQEPVVTHETTAGGQESSTVKVTETSENQSTDKAPEKTPEPQDNNNNNNNAPKENVGDNDKGDKNPADKPADAAPALSLFARAKNHIKPFCTWKIGAVTAVTASAVAFEYACLQFDIYNHDISLITELLSQFVGKSGQEVVAEDIEETIQELLLLTDAEKQELLETLRSGQVNEVINFFTKALDGILIERAEAQVWYEKLFAAHSYYFHKIINSVQNSFSRITKLCARS